jgi:hypothetical protein
MADFEYLIAIIDEMTADIETKIQAEINTGQEDLLAKIYAKHKELKVNREETKVSHEDMTTHQEKMEATIKIR